MYCNPVYAHNSSAPTTENRRNGETHIFLTLSSDRLFRYRIVALHSTLSSKDQAAAFTVPPAGVRKVLLNVL